MNTLLLAGTFDNVGKILESFLNEWWSPLLVAIAALAVLLGVAAGVKYWFAAQSGDEQKLKQAKSFVVGIVLGIVIIFIIAAIVPVIIACLQSWYDNEAPNYVSSLITTLF